MAAHSFSVNYCCIQVYIIVLVCFIAMTEPTCLYPCLYSWLEHDYSEYHVSTSQCMVPVFCRYPAQVSILFIVRTVKEDAVQRHIFQTQISDKSRLAMSSGQYMRGIIGLRNTGLG